MARIDFSEYAVNATAGVPATHQAPSNHAQALAQLIESIAGAHVTVSPQAIGGDLAGYASQLRAQMCTVYRLASMLGETLTEQGAGS
ncbi:hypothetical protein [Ralstonia insidiosa]|uniref:Uncharacterized protein n=1 Tax=Ralstonia insidiosa TaxID=190721 RepID=A0A848P931_9RALS|nr:hypothetical protein [Ralstonia insidiosa]NMV41845.1 hypothetical protein [Ralstonia insidiosa]